MTTLATVKTSNKLAWGPVIEHTNKPYLYPPQTVEKYVPPPAGVDNLGITSTDVFMVPRVGEFTVDFKGYVRVVRSDPTTDKWQTADVYTNLFDLYMYGETEKIGPIIVSLNPQFVSTGQIKTPFGDETQKNPAKACRMAVGALFELPQLGLTLFNKEPIELTIDDVRSIPPAGNPGVGRIYRMLPLFDVANPQDKPAAYLTGLNFLMGTYINENQIQALKLH